MTLLLRSHGKAANPQIHDYTVPRERKRLLEIADSIQLPRSIADSLYAFIPTETGMLVILGHVPPNLIDSAFTSPDVPPRLVLCQPKMVNQPSIACGRWRVKYKPFRLKHPEI